MECAYRSGPSWGQSLEWGESPNVSFLSPPAALPHPLQGRYLSPRLVWDALRSPCPLPWKVLPHLHTRNFQGVFLWRRSFISIAVQHGWCFEAGGFIVLQTVLPRSFPELGPGEEEGGDKLTWMFPNPGVGGGQWAGARRTGTLAFSPGLRVSLGLHSS